MLSSPYPYFGGKSQVIRQVWKRFGHVRNFVDPFFGSGASILGRPEPFEGGETINDIDGYLSNFWRAIAADPSLTASYADWPVNENDLHARHAWLVSRRDNMQAKPTLPYRHLWLRGRTYAPRVLGMLRLENQGRYGQPIFPRFSQSGP